MLSGSETVNTDLSEIRAVAFRNGENLRKAGEVPKKKKTAKVRKPVDK